MSSEESSQPASIGPYEVLELIGRGSMGKVYKVTRSPQPLVAALRLMPESVTADPERLERWEQDVAAATKLKHANVVQVLDHGVEENQHYMVMEYVEGQPLEEVMRDRRLSIAEALSVFKGVCQGLDAAHRAGIVHRYLSPKSILVSPNLATVKVGEFGMSGIERVAQSDKTLSTGSFSMGALNYLAPEQVSGSEPDQRSDIYSAGVLLYELLTGRVPVGSFSLPSQLSNEVPSEVDAVILKCLSSNPAQRYLGVGQLLDAVGALEDRLKLGLVRELKGLGTTSRIVVRSTGSLMKGKSLVVILAVVAVAAIGFALVVMRGGSEKGPTDVPTVAAALSPEAADAVAGEQTGEDELGAAETEAPAAVAGGPAPSVVAPSQTATPTTTTLPPNPAAGQPAAGTPPAVRQGSPDDTAAEDLRVALEKARAGLNDPALADLRRFLEEHPGHPSLPEAYLAIARIHAAEGNTEQAMATYVEIRSRFGGSPQAYEARFRHAELLSRERGKDSQEAARLAFAELAEAAPDTEWGRRALLAQARLEKENRFLVSSPEFGRAPAELSTWERFVNRYPDDPEVEGALWTMGEIYEDLKAYPQAAKAFSELATRFPRTEYDAWWRAGQLYDRRLDDVDRARAAYGNVPESSKNYRDAQRRLNRLD